MTKKEFCNLLKIVVSNDWDLSSITDSISYDDFDKEIVNFFSNFEGSFIMVNFHHEGILVTDNNELKDFITYTGITEIDNSISDELPIKIFNNTKLIQKECKFFEIDLETFAAFDFKYID